MDNSLIFRLRLIRCTDLVLQWLKRSLQQQGPSNQDPTAQRITLRFLDFEKKLLDNLYRTYFPSEPSVPATEKSPDFLIKLLFSRWSWMQDTYRQVLTCLDPLEVEEEHAGNQVEAWEMARTLIQKVQNIEYKEERFTRAARFEEDNQVFIEALGGIDRESIDVVPVAEDRRYWTILAKMFQGNGDDFAVLPGFRAVLEALVLDAVRCLSGKVTNETADVEGIDDAGSDDGSDLSGDEMDDDHNQMLRTSAANDVDMILDAEDTWNIWRTCRTYRLLHKRPSNWETISSFLETEPFQKVWEVVVQGHDDDEMDVDEEDRYGQTISMRQPFEQDRISALMPEFFGENRLEWATLIYRQKVHEAPLVHPSLYLEALQSSKLTRVTEAEGIKMLFSDLGLEFDPGEDIVIWSTEDSQAIFSHALYINEDIYSYNVLNDFHFPGYLWEGKPLFRCQKIEHTDFCEKIRRYWDDWNDCAITQDQKTGAWLLLETLPGIKARLLAAEYGDGAVRSFFGSLTVQHKQDYRPDPHLLQNLLGQAYDPKYKNFLRYIDPGELHLDTTSLIGSGSFGQVFKTLWDNKPRTYGHFDDTAVGDVVLKIAHGSYQQELVQSPKFFEELRLAHTALSGGNAGFIEFLGFTKIFMNSRNELSPDEHSDDRSGVFALVFDFASEGTVLEYLQDHLQPSAVLENWLKITNVLSGVIEGLSVVHKHEIVHRDIHPNNVLVNKRYFKNSNTYEYSCTLSDLGEGKSAGYQPQADIYDFGRLAIDIIRVNHQYLIEEGQQSLRIPAKLASILESCLDDDPTERWPARVIVHIIDTIQGELSGDRVSWVDSEEFLSRPTIRAKSHSLASTLRSSLSHQASPM